MDWGRYLIQRALGAFLVIFGVTLAVFVVLRLSGDPAALFMSPMATEEEYARIQEQMGLDKPLPVQYVVYLGQLLRGDFGTSYQRNEPAMSVVLDRLPATLRLTAAAVFLLLILGIPFGALAAIYRGTWIDSGVSSVTLIAQAVPNYWLGIMLVLLFAVQLRWLPTSGSAGWQALVLPAVTLALQPWSRLTRLVRSELLDVLRQDYVRTARAKGLSEQIVMRRHAFRNAAVPVVTVLGLDLGYLLGGAIIVEAIFAWPGLGNLMIQAISNQDFPVIQASVILMAGTVVLLSLITDFLYVWLDPRVRLQ
jgi:ABC-type dipeptide/oligopeptide/nickel transport system permease component